MTLYNTSACFIISLFLVSCTTTEEIVCDVGKLAVYATGFREADLDSAIVIRYDAGQSFSTPRDTAFLRLSRIGRDTLWLVTTSYQARTPVPFPSGYLDFGADYRLYLPKLNRWFEFSDLTLAGNYKQTIIRRKRSTNNYLCFNNVVSCSVDGVKTVVQEHGIEEVVFISK